MLPNTVAGEGRAESRRGAALIDKLTRVEALRPSPSRQIPLRASVPVPVGGLRLTDLQRIAVSYEAAADALEPALRLARELWGL